MSSIFRALALVVVVLLVPAVSVAATNTVPPPAVPVSADRLNPLKPVDTSSPSATYQSFVSGARTLDRDYEDYLAHKTAAKAAALLTDVGRLHRLLDLDPLPPAIRFKMGNAAFGYLADILNRLPEVTAADIPGAPGRDWGELPEKWRIPGTAITIARVKDGPSAGEYLFTTNTVKRLAHFHDLIIGEPPLRPVRFANWHREQVNFTGPFFSDQVLRLLPEPLMRTVLDTPIWKVALTILVVVSMFLTTWAWARLAWHLGRAAGEAGRLGWRLSVPLFFLGLYYLTTVFIRSQINLSGDFALGERFFSTTLLYAAGAWAAWVACFFIVETIIASPRIPDHSYDAHLLRITARLGAALSAGALLVYGANAIGIPALGLVAGLSIGGLAFALASKQSLENLFGGLALFADRPFRVGDFIHYGSNGQGGWVESIGSRSSRIRALDGTLTTVPNGDLANLHINNFSMRSKCLFLHEIGVRYETSPAQIEWLVAKIYDLLAAHPKVEKAPGFPRVVLIGFGASSINLQIRAHVLTPDLSEFLKIQEQLLLEIMRAVDAAGTGFAFPSQTTYFARDSGIDLATQARLEAQTACKAPLSQTATREPQQV